MTTLRSLCSSIVHCKVADGVLTRTPLDATVDELRCAAPIRAQLIQFHRARPDQPAATSRARWLVPEPWNGDLLRARLLFIGQNPAADHREQYPTGEDAARLDEDQLLHYFNNRFDSFGPPNLHPPSGPRVRPPLRAGGYGTPNPFLMQMHALATLLWNKADPIQAGRDYAITEAVRCKTTKTSDVDHAASVCTRRYMPDTLRLSGAQVLICFGGPASDAVGQLCLDSAELGWSLENTASGDRVEDLKAIRASALYRLDLQAKAGPRTFLIVFLAHPQARGNKLQDQIAAISPGDRSVIERTLKDKDPAYPTEDERPGTAALPPGIRTR